MFGRLYVEDGMLRYALWPHVCALSHREYSQHGPADD